MALGLAGLAPKTAAVTFGFASGDASLNAALEAVAAFVEWFLDTVVVVDAVVVVAVLQIVADDETIDGVLLVADSSAVVVVVVDPHGPTSPLPFPPVAAMVDFVALTVAGLPEMSVISRSK